MHKEWEHVVVLGAAGKMGSGIALLLLQEMASMPGSHLTLLDTNAQGFEALKKYLREHMLRYAEKSINRLRLHYEDRDDLIDNGDMIRTFVEDAIDRVRLVTSIGECHGASMIFEAILENIDVKAKVFSEINKIASPEAIYFTNTSSIPIHILEKQSQIEGRLVGFHFYNPPAVQKLVEIIVPHGLKKGILEIALKVGKRLNKTIVFSEDIAGFIGNGHFIREASEACRKVEELSHKMSLTESICLVNTITQDYLVRPMGIFQLIDYVGIDVVQNIVKVMGRYLSNQTFNISLIDEMASAGVKGGQNGDGTQKDGFFTYIKGQPAQVYDLGKKGYTPYAVSAEVQKMAKGHASWKVLSKDGKRSEKLSNYFETLWGCHSTSAKLAINFLENSRKIAHGLVSEGVARSVGDVDTVLQNGFFHLYGVDAPWKEIGGAE
ncbi:MAG TPA: 3-hydroxyacyl-CoA dehydrogenase family protein [Parachlamydiaceae bacterium]|nr:3-hydroxyacyl-CoA dehydrogenase family protein [Parachlamydiaceae bacterium]